MYGLQAAAAGLLDEVKTILLNGDAKALDKFYRRDDIKKFLDNLSEDSGSHLIKVRYF